MEHQGRVRRQKVTEGAANRTGTFRAAVKPTKTSESPSVKQVVEECLAKVRGSLRETYLASQLKGHERQIRASFGLSGSDEVFCLCDPTGTARAGLVLASSGVFVADGRGANSSMSWVGFAQARVGVQRGMLVVGQHAISTRDAQALAPVLTQIQAKLA